MRPLIVLVLGAALAAAGCGQKGPLVRPTRSSTTPVVIRAPAPAPGTPDPAKTPADPDAAPR
jgi:predicted small lipoprotein YifL